MCTNVLQTELRVFGAAKTPVAVFVYSGKLFAHFSEFTHATAFQTATRVEN